MRRSVIVALTVVLLLLALAANAAPAMAHETLSAGDLAIEVGWGTEPAYAGQLNTIQAIVTHKVDGDPITDEGARLNALVRYGDRQQTFALAPTYDAESGTGTPGEYAALVIPTAPGDYTFVVRGTIESIKVNVKSTSSPTTFSPVLDASAVQFPTKVPGTDQLAQRLDKGLARAATVNDIDAQVSGARTAAYIGIAVGAVGIVLAAVALLTRRRV